MTDDLEDIRARVGHMEDMSSLRLRTDNMAKLTPARLGDSGMPPEPTVGYTPFDIATLVAAGAIDAATLSAPLLFTINAGRIPGPDGADGDDGQMGPPGTAGVAGAAGARGIDGRPGIDGSDGEDGWPGSPGERGASGIQGVAGPNGLQGPPGFAIDGDDGYDGVPGQPGPQGVAGTAGARGADGTHGMDGNDGDDGWGFPGAQGFTGAQGVAGPNGLSGPPGYTGDDGDEGQMGPPGPTAAFVIPAIALSNAAAAGVAPTLIRSDATIVAFDAVAPVTQAFSDVAATGAIALAARRDHKHGMPAGSLSGHGAADHADITRTIFLVPQAANLDGATFVAVGASPNLSMSINYADAATQGAYWMFLVPSDWASGVISITPLWTPAATDAVAHTVRWSVSAKEIGTGTDITAAGTTTAFTGASAARTVNVTVTEAAQSTGITPSASNVRFRIELQRIGADALDTYVGAVRLYGIVVSYTANQ